MLSLFEKKEFNMKINFAGEIKDLEKGISLLQEDMDFTQDSSGREVKVIKGEDGLLIDVNENGATISYNTPASFFRGLSILVDAFKNGTCLKINENPAFETLGVMFDVSRGAVLKVSTVKDYLRCMARMGYNELMLYTEDVFELENYPYFGYMRGRYTEQELSEIIAYGESLGIETVPCIQTLGHLFAPLRWSDFSSVRDQKDILLIGEDETYKLIDEIIKTCRRIFKTDKIHIGMDEAHGVGLGEYLLKNGYRNRYEIMSEHLYKVSAICKNYGFKPMMWSDMFFRLSNEGNSYYSSSSCLPENIAELIPDGISEVYWDYYNNSEYLYNVMMSEHKKMQCPVIFAGGVWVWSGPSVNYRQTFESSIPALKACKEHGVSHVLATLWGDDGSECDYCQSLYGLQFFAEACYNGENAEKELDRRFEICNGYDAELFKLLDVDNFPVPSYYEDYPDFGELQSYIINTSKQVLYQNPLMGLFDKNFAMTDLHSHYEDILKKLETVVPPKKLETMFAVHKKLVQVLLSKCDIGIRLKNAYDKNDRNVLKLLSEELKNLSGELSELLSLRKKLWYENNKPFGMEQLLERMSGIVQLTVIAYERIDAYINDEISCVEELEQDRLLYNGFERPHFMEYFSQKMIMPNNNEMGD